MRTSTLVAFLLVGVVFTEATAQYSPSWSFQISDRLGAFITDIAEDSSGNVLVCGYLAADNYRHPDGPADDVIINDEVHEIPRLASEAFLAKFRPDGERIWIRFIEGNIRFQHLAIDAHGNINVGGYFHDTLTFDDVFMQQICVSDIFLAGADSNGYFRWSQVFGGTWYEYADDIACDKSGNVYIAGGFYDSLSCSLGTLYTKASGRDFFITQVAPDGNLAWIKYMNTEGGATCVTLDIDIAGNVVLGGRLDKMEYLMRLNSAGNPSAFHEFSHANAKIADLAILPDDSYLLLMNISDSVTIGSQHVPSPDSGNTATLIVNIRSNGSTKFVVYPSIFDSSVIMHGSGLSIRNNIVGIVGEIAGATLLDGFLLGKPFVHQDSASVWVATMDLTGNMLWMSTMSNNTFSFNRARNPSNEITNMPHSVLTHKDGNLYAAGHYHIPFDEGNVHIGPPAQYASNRSNRNAFVIKYEQSPAAVLTDQREIRMPIHSHAQGRTIYFELTEEGEVLVSLYDILGREIEQLHLERANPSQAIECPASGTYIALMKNNEGQTSKLFHVTSTPQ